MMESSAVISKCKRYRYRLYRKWGDGPTCGFIMLNPSTADANVDDPTIRRCIGFAKRENCGSLIVGNLYPLRATDPEALLEEDTDPDGEGSLNIDYLDQLCAEVTGPLIAAWGAHRAVDCFIEAYLRGEYADRLMCLGKTRNGSPRHPLYIRGDTPLQLLKGYRE